MVRVATNTLLTSTLADTIAGCMKEMPLLLPQLVQISINTTHLEASCAHLEEYISSATHSYGDGLRHTSLHGGKVFARARTAAEDGILRLFVQQIDAFLSVADYDWTPEEPRTACSAYISDALAYLTTMFNTLTSMPVDVARHAYFNTCKYLSSQLMGFIGSPSTRKINISGIHSFALDVEACEEYAHMCPFVEPGDELLAAVFDTPRQVRPRPVLATLWAPGARAAHPWRP